MVCPHLTHVHSGERKRLPWVRDKFYLVHGSEVIFNVSVLGYFFYRCSMLRRRLVLHLCQRLDERLEGVWDIQGSKHTKSVYPALPLEILGFANKGHIALCRVQDSGTAVGGGGFRCHLRHDLHTLVSKGMRYMYHVQKYSLGYRKQYANYTDGYKHASRCGYVVLK